ncbi:MAG: hypothetical protein HUK19_04090, partial [Fibrobacter sp.]|nr:hypothetical protein [Fibrobacter sp.]
PLLYLTKSTAHEKMTQRTYQKLLYLLKMLAEKGEKETLKFMKKCKELPESGGTRHPGLSLPRT